MSSRMNIAPYSSESATTPAEDDEPVDLSVIQRRALLEAIERQKSDILDRSGTTGLPGSDHFRIGVLIGLDLALELITDV